MQVKLEDIVPQSAEFTLSKTGKTYKLRAISLADEIWLQKTFGDGLEKILKEIRMEEICRIVFHQLEPESQQEFAAQDITIMNEQGESVKGRVGGAVLLHCMIQGFDEKLKIFYALMETIGISRPMIDKMVGEETVKKKVSLPTGQKSSTSSPRSTGGQRTTSSRARSAR